MRSIDARQGVLSFGYFRLDKQTKVTRASARNPNSNTTHSQLKPQDTKTNTARTSRTSADIYPLRSALSRNNRLDMPRRPMRRQIVRRLQIDPELRRRIERLGQQPGRIRRNTPLATNDLVHPLNRNTEMSRQRLLAQAKRLQKLGGKNRPRVRRYTTCGNHADQSVSNSPLFRAAYGVQRQVGQKAASGYEHQAHHDIHSYISEIWAIFLSICRCSVAQPTAMDNKAIKPLASKNEDAEYKLVKSQPIKLTPVTIIIPSHSLRYASSSLSPSSFDIDTRPSISIHDSTKALQIRSTQLTDHFALTAQSV
ncbi:hypothetical protein V5738_09465 [Salinisphaera sp. SPP-AMP-43]|uniref:hypothetical protein n=1 Tax=Salinisphaera sp. SPP-AMP-43 TaxID=3121288 RepID=UPI003C6E97F3